MTNLPVMHCPYMQFTSLVKAGFEYDHLVSFLRLPPTETDYELKVIDPPSPQMDKLYNALMTLMLCDNVTCSFQEDEFEKNRFNVEIQYGKTTIVVKDLEELVEAANLFQRTDDDAVNLRRDIEGGLKKCIFDMLDSYLISDETLRRLLRWPEYYFHRVCNTDRIEWPELQRLFKIHCISDIARQYESVNFVLKANGVAVCYKPSMSSDEFLMRPIRDVEDLERFAKAKKTEENENIVAFYEFGDCASFIKEREIVDHFTFSRLLRDLVRQMEKIGVPFEVIVELTRIAPRRLMYYFNGARYLNGDLLLNDDQLLRLFELYKSVCTLKKKCPNIEFLWNEQYERADDGQVKVRVNVLAIANGKLQGIVGSVADLQRIA